MKQIYTTTLRLNLADEDDRRAYEHLQRMNKKQYRSYSKAIVTAINDYLNGKTALQLIYLESREKEDAFLRRVTEIIEKSLHFAPAAMLSFTPAVAPKEANTADDEELSAALDFADSF